MMSTLHLQVPPAWGGMIQAGTGLSIASGQGNPLGGQGPMDTESRVSVINLKDGTRLAGDDAPKRRELELWLKEHPGFVADTGAFIPVSPSLPLPHPLILHSSIPNPGFIKGCEYTVQLQ